MSTVWKVLGGKKARTQFSPSSVCVHPAVNESKAQRSGNEVIIPPHNDLGQTSASLYEDSSMGFNVASSSSFGIHDITKTSPSITI